MITIWDLIFLYVGEVPIRPKDKTEVQTSIHKKSHYRTSSDTTKQIEKHQESSSSSCFGKRLGSIKKSEKALKDGQDGYEVGVSTYPKSTKGYEFKNNRSLPRTHKLQVMKKSFLFFLLTAKISVFNIEHIQGVSESSENISRVKSV